VLTSRLARKSGKRFADKFLIEKIYYYVTNEVISNVTSKRKEHVREGSVR